MTTFVDGDRLGLLMKAFDDLQEETAQLLNRHGHHPSADSVAARELSTYPSSELVLTAYAQADLLIEALAEHIVAFRRSAIEPALAMASWACVRAAVESSGLACWLLDPAIDAGERVKRSFAFRFEGLDQQAKLARAVGDKPALDATLKRIDAIEQKALSLGFARVIDKKGHRVGIGQVMPKITILVGQSLGEENTYRLLSAVTHAHPWALQQAGFLPLKNDSSSGKSVALKKTAKAICFKYLSNKAVAAFSRPIVYKARIFGWDTAYTERRINSYIEEINRLSSMIAAPIGDLEYVPANQSLKRTPDGAA